VKRAKAKKQLLKTEKAVATRANNYAAVTHGYANVMDNKSLLITAKSCTVCSECCLNETEDSVDEA